MLTGLLSLWVPGDQPESLTDSALALPRDATLVVRVRYRKTWEYERRAMTDQSQIGLYFAPASARPVQRLTVSAGAPITLRRAAQALAVYPDEALSGVGAALTALHPDGRRDELIAFHPRAGWARRYWFREPVRLPAGTRLSVRITPDSPALLPPGFIVPPPARRDASTARLFVNIVQ